jgi:hypothetical protein
MEYLGRMMETRKASKFWSGNLSLGDQGVDMRTVGLGLVTLEKYGVNWIQVAQKSQLTRFNDHMINLLVSGVGHWLLRKQLRDFVSK